jgi:predicted metalloprotease with PDZ domain
MSVTRLPPLIEHRVECFDLSAHLFRVTLTIAQPAAQQRIALPVWIPGSYLVREFAKQLQGMTASQAGKKIGITQIDKCTWMLDCKASSSGQAAPVQVSYWVYAFDASVRTAYLDNSRGFFNGTSLFMRVIGQESSIQQVLIDPPKEIDDWRAATALVSVKTNKAGWGIYQADNYDELADSPFELGDFWEGTFIARGIKHRFVVSGAAPTFDGQRLLADTQKIVETELAFWHGNSGKPPKALLDKGYVFMLYATADGYGGLEHKNSTALIAKRSDLPRLGESAAAEGASLPSDGYITLLGLISHEYFHTWNVKRLRPSELASYDYAHENHTKMLWFFEGFTSYYDDLLLRRAGLINDQQYLGLLAKTINQVQQTPGRLVHPLSGSSFEAWTKYYRPDENSVNSTVSYYTKGALVALCLDLSLRQCGRTSLDHVMRALWERSHQNGNDGVMSEADLLDVLQRLGGRSFAREIKAWVHGVKDLPLTELLATAGVETALAKAPLAQQLGLKLDTASGLKIKSVLSHSAAAKAGFSAGDEWLAIDVKGQTGNQTWRITSMDDVALYAPAGKPILAWVARDRIIVKLRLALPKTALLNGNVTLRATQAAPLNNWLGS